MLYQSRIWTSTGVPRKIQMYSQLAPETSGLGERRMTASTIPSAIPIAIDVAVSSSVTTTPSRMRREKNQSPTIPHPNRLFVAIELASATVRNRRIAVATQRPGWRTGIALISSALTGSAVSVAITPQSRPWLADRAVDRRVVDRPLLDL